VTRFLACQQTRCSATGRRVRFLPGRPSIPCPWPRTVERPIVVAVAVAVKMVVAVVVRDNLRCGGDTCWTAVGEVGTAAEVAAGRGSVVDDREQVQTVVSSSCVWLWNQTHPDLPRRHRSPWPVGRDCASPSRHLVSVPKTASARVAAALAVGRMPVVVDRRLIATSRK